MDQENNKRKTLAYKDIIWSTNKHLKEIAIQAGMEIPITTYYARYSVATIAYSLKVPQGIISELLGHQYGSEMTAIYIEKDTKHADEAMRMVIDAIKNQ